MPHGLNVTCHRSAVRLEAPEAAERILAQRIFGECTDFAGAPALPLCEAAARECWRGAPPLLDVEGAAGLHGAPFLQEVEGFHGAHLWLVCLFSLTVGEVLASFGRSGLGCIEADFRKKVLV